jgi:CSLREA domain-containing protein
MFFEAGIRMRRFFRLSFALLCLMLGAAGQVQAATFIVNSTDSVADGVCDVTHCSLDDAINAANASPGADRIEFNILPAGVTHTLIRATELPPITEDIVIDGYTQPGSSTNSSTIGALDTVIRIQIQAATPAVAVGLRIQASNVTVNGLAIANFETNILISDTSTGVVIAGNFIGTQADGLTAMGSTTGVACDLCAGVTVGGSTATERNLISGNVGYGIRTSRPAGSTPVKLFVLGNLIGTDRTAAAALGNGVGVYIWTPTTGASTDDVINIGNGGAVQNGNVISGNTLGGVRVQRDAGTDLPLSSCVISGNFIGTNHTGTAQLPNGGAGVTTQGPVQVSILSNTIAYNTGSGVEVDGPLTTAGSGVSIQGNSIKLNTGLGIDLGNDGRTGNDGPPDLDPGANELLNFPFLGQAEVDPVSGVLQISGVVLSNPSRSYVIAFYNIGTVYRGPGMDAITPIGTWAVATNSSGVAPFTVSMPGGLASPGDGLVATLSVTSTNITSEISDPVGVTQSPTTIKGTITLAGAVPLANVTVALTGTESRSTTTDSGGNYQFAALTTGGNYTVTPQASGYTFSPPVYSYTNLAGVHTAPFSATPVPLTYTVNVTHDHGDGVCTPAECTLREAITAANAHHGTDTIAFAIPGAGPHFVVIDSALPSLGSDLVIDGYTQAGSAPNTNATGGLNGVLTIALSRGAIPGPNAIALTVTGSRVTVRGLVIAGFDLGIVLTNPSTAINDVVLAGNYFGTTPDGLTAVAGSGAAIFAFTPAGLTIGGSTPAARNLVSGHSSIAISATAGYNGRPSTFTVRGNLIGTDVTGVVGLGNDTGISFFSSPNPPEADIVCIGGDAPGEGNVISGNVNGVVLGRGTGSDLDGADQQMVGNSVGVAADGETPLGNSNEGMQIYGQVKYAITRNVFAYNAYNAVSVMTTPTTGGFGVDFSENRFFGNGFIAIDLDNNGRTPNDADDSDTGANDQQNFPVLSVQENLHSTTVNGTLTSRPHRTYRIEVFTTGPFLGGGRLARQLVGSFTTTTDGNGSASFTHEYAQLFESGERFTATATDVDAMMTSELSDDVALTPPPQAAVAVTITLNGAPLDEASVTITGDRTLSRQTGGHYLFGLPIGGTYILAPSAPGYVFTPASAQVTNLTAEVELTFTARLAILTRYLPEGAAGPFWETSIALLNGGTTATTAEVSFLKPDGTSTKIDVPLTGPGHAVIDPATVPGLNGTSFSTVIKASEPLTASRTMRWGERRELGAHAEQALSDPRTSWYFAEGATGCFDLFYLFVNPGATPAEVDVTFVRRAPETPLVKHYTVGAFSRATIQANAEDGLEFAEVSAHVEVTNGQPIVAERAMYSRCSGTPWLGGHDAVASEAPASEWFFAEGATGSFFDLYLLIANFETQDAKVDVEYLLDDGSTLKKRYTVPAGSRVTIDVAGESPLLAQASVSAIVRSKNGVPVVAERSQWWPHGRWYEGHASAGVVQTGIEWQLAGAEVGGAHGSQAFLLIANTSDDAASAQVRIVFNDGTTATLAQPVSLAAHSRTTVALAEAFPAARDKTFGIIVESLGAKPAPIVVELSTYNDTPEANESGGGPRFWGAGTNVVATRVR